MPLDIARSTSAAVRNITQSRACVCVPDSEASPLGSFANFGRGKTTNTIPVLQALVHNVDEAVGYRGGKAPTKMRARVR